MSKIYDAIKTRGLEIVDNEDRVRIMFGVDDDQAASAIFRDLNGKIKLVIAVTHDGDVHIAMCPDGKPRLTFTAGQDGSSQIAAFSGPTGSDEGGEPAFAIMAHPEPKASGIMFYDRDGEEVAFIGGKAKHGGIDGQIELSKKEKIFFQVPK